MKKRVIYLIAELVIVAVFAVIMLLNLTPGTGGSVSTTSAADLLRGSYSLSQTTIWMEEYQKNLLGKISQQLDLFTDGTYVLSMHNQCIANMDTDIVTNAAYDPFYESRMTLTGKYEVVSEPDALGIMEIRLADANLKAVSGNFVAWPSETDGERNFEVAAAGESLEIDTTTLTMGSFINMYTLTATE